MEIKVEAPDPSRRLSGALELATSPPQAATRESSLDDTGMEYSGISYKAPPSTTIRVRDLTLRIKGKAQVDRLAFLKRSRDSTKEQETELTGDPGASTADIEGTGDGGKTILNKVSCDCLPGEVLAILGGSGSGKTSLLNAMGSRAGTPPTVMGGVRAYNSTVLLNEKRTETPGSGAPDRSMETLLSGKEMKKRIGFVRQADYLVEHLTVRETLSYAAALRLPSRTTSAMRKQIVDQTLEELGLMDSADTLVGGVLRKGISGGEKRRLSIGCVLVTLPSVLILDEPTSGLDAFTAFLLLQTLSRLARRGRTIILSLHAPRSDAFALFDRIVLLTRGEVAYSGLRSEVMDWFGSLGRVCDPGVNPLDFMVDISSIDNRTPEQERLTKISVGSLVYAWKRRQESFEVETQLLLNPDKTKDNTNAADKDVPEKRPSIFRQTSILLQRNHKELYRNYPLLLAFLLQSVLISGVIGLAFLRLKPTPTDIQSLKNLSFQSFLVYTYLVQVFWTWQYCRQLVIFDRELEDRLYAPAAYVFADVATNLLPSFVFTLIYAVILYYVSGLRSDDLAKNLLLLATSGFGFWQATQALSFASASVLRDYASASIVANVANLFQLMSVGFLLVDVPPYVRWIRYIAPQYYNFRVVFVTQFQNRVFDCPAGQVTSQCNGDNVLTGFGVPKGQIGSYLGSMFALAIGLYMVAALMLTIYKPGGMKHAALGKRTLYDSTEARGFSKIASAKVSVEIRNLSCEFHRRTLKGEKIVKPILNNLSMSFPGGQLSAILGPSGAGKSTLLQLIAQRHLSTGPGASFKHSGEILYGDPDGSELEKGQIELAYVEQHDDWHYPALTVRETLRYAAKLRLPAHLSAEQKISRAEQVLLQLGLKDCADTPVGGALVKGISGGELRRLSLAVEMVNNPAILVVDEPTSGLDSAIALNVMIALRDIALSGKTVIVTIHQPRSDIWAILDNVVLLSGAGSIVFGGKRPDALHSLEDVGFSMKTQYGNPADHLLDTVSVDPRPAGKLASLDRIQTLADHWQRTMSTMSKTPLDHFQRKLGSHHASPMWKTTPTVLRRMWINLWRQQTVAWNRLTQAPGLALVYFIFFLRIGNGPSSAQNRIGITIQSTTAMTFVGLLNALAVFPPDFALFLHESQSSAAYSPATFLAAYTAIEMPNLILSSLGAGLFIILAMGLNPSVSHYFEFSLTILAQQSMGESLGIAFLCFGDSAGLSVSLVSTVLSILCLISGVISLSTPDWLSGIAWISPLKSVTRAQIINALEGSVFDCSTEDLISGVCIARTGDEALGLFNFTDLNVGRYLGIAVGTTVAWRIAAWLVLCIKVRRP